MTKHDFYDFGKQHDSNRVFFLTEETKQLMLNAIDQDFVVECDVKTLGGIVGMINQKYSDNNLTNAEYNAITDAVKADFLA